MSQIPAHFFSKEPKRTNFLLPPPPLKPYVCSCLNVPGRVRLFVPVHHEVFGAVSRGASVCYVLSARPFLLFSLSCPVTFKTHCLPLCCSLLHLSFFFSPVTPLRSSLPFSLWPLCHSFFSLMTGWLTTGETPQCRHRRLRSPSHRLQQFP